MISSFRLEALENRQLLSVAAPVAAEFQPLHHPAVAALAAQPKLVANTYFLGSPTLSGMPGKLALKIKTVPGTAVTATLYSTNWGGFTVAVAGTINSAGAISLTGQSSTCRVTAFKGTLSSTSKVITGSVTIVQMGLALKGTMTQTRTLTAPVLTTPRYPSVLGNYRGTRRESGQPTVAITASITKQTGALFWGGTTVTGFQSAPGVFYLQSVDPDGYSIVSGIVHSNGSLSGTYTHYNKDGSKGTGTLLLYKV